MAAPLHRKSMSWLCTLSHIFITNVDKTSAHRVLLFVRAQLYWPLGLRLWFLRSKGRGSQSAVKHLTLKYVYSTHWIVTPDKYTPGVPQPITFSFYNTTNDVTVSIALLYDDHSPVSTLQHTFQNGKYCIIYILWAMLLFPYIYIRCVF